MFCVSVPVLHSVSVWSSDTGVPDRLQAYPLAGGAVRRHVPHVHLLPVSGGRVGGQLCLPLPAQCRQLQRVSRKSAHGLDWGELLGLCLGWYGHLMVLYKTEFNLVTWSPPKCFSNHFLMISSTAHILEYKMTN